MSKKHKIIGITMGDPAGVGAEISVKAIEKRRLPEDAIPMIIGDCTAVVDAMSFTNSSMALNIVKRPCEVRDEPGVINLLDLSVLRKGDWIYGEISARAGKASVAYIEKAIELALNKEINAVVSGPINEKSISLAGCPYSGQTEIFASMTGSKDYTIMLADGNFRVAHVSTHVPLIEACKRATRQRVLTVIKLTHEALLKLGIASPRIAVAGLNPHAGDSGFLGEEEDREIRPAIEDAMRLGIYAEGPTPPDTIFLQTVEGHYDAVVVMYHDQGHIPLKLARYYLDGATGRGTTASGVTLTLGLPFIRTCVYQGTAYGKAGKGTADAESMRQAIEMAVGLSDI